MDNKRTLETHKWFVNKIKKIAEEQQKQHIENINTYIKFIFICGLASLYNYHLTLFIFMFVTPTIFIITKKENNLYMRFTRPGIFYKNTHYIFSGTKAELKKAFERLKHEVEDIKKEYGFGRGDHDNLLDIPLDTFCNNHCHCNVDPIENYYCSHWELHSYETHEDLLAEVKRIEKGENKMNFQGYHNEILYI